jgi:hypothetical protein
MTKFLAQCVFSLLIIVILIVGLYAGRDWPARSTRMLPWIVGFPILALSIIHFVLVIVRGREVWLKEKTRAPEDPVGGTEAAPSGPVFKKMVFMWGWLAGLALAIWIFGFLYSVPFFLCFFLKLEAKLGWLVSIIYSILTTVAVYVLFEAVLGIRWPLGMVAEMFG